MNHSSKWMDWLITAALPLAFFGSGFLNMFAFLLGLHNYDSARTMITFGILGVTALFLFCRVGLLYAKTPELHRPILAASLILVLFGLIYLWTLGRQTDKFYVLKETMVSGCYLVSAWSALILIAVEKRLRAFLRACRFYALILSPIVIFYCVRFYLPGANDYSRNLGVLTYMDLAYALLEICVFLYLEVLLYDGDAGPAPFFGVNLGLTLLFSAAIALSGTKGTILCFMFFCVLFVLYLVIKTAPRRWYLFPACTCLSIVLFLSLLFPSAALSNRFAGFLNELTGGFMLSEETIQKAFAAMKKIEPNREPSNPLTAGDIVAACKNGTAKKMWESGVISWVEYDAMETFAWAINNTSMGARMYLWQSALREIKSTPLIGQGPFFFQMKYGTYPHNFFLELATDFGLIVALTILIFGMYVFFRLCRIGHREPVYMAFLLYVLAFLPENMLSGSAYSNSVFFQYGFCVLTAFLPEKVFIAKRVDAD